MPTPSFFPTLLTRSVQNGWVTPSLAKKAQALVQLGIHPEQALIGTGLLQDVQYGELLQELGTFPFLRVADRTSVSHSQDMSFVVLVNEPQRLVFGFTDPFDRDAREAAEQEAWEQEKTFEGFMVLWSDVRPVSSEDRSAASVWRDVRAQVPPEALHIRLQPGDGHVHLIQGFDIRAPHEGSVPYSAMPALQERVRRRGRHHGWQAEPMAFGWRQGLQLVRVEDGARAHPTGWMQTWQQFRKNPEGVLVLINPDPFTDRLLRNQLPARQSNGELVFLDARSEEGKEQVLLSALQDEALVAAADSMDWLEPLRSAGVSVQVIEATHVPHGTSWSSYRL